MADVFVSYSRHDGAFVHELHDVLVGAGRDVWVDWEDIPPASHWQEDIDDSIDAAESVVFVVSASSLASEYCAEEFQHAQKGGKRVVPIAIDGADPAAAPPALRELNWIWARATDDRAAAFEALERALDTDLEWSRAHTRLLVRAVEWDERKDGSLLLRGKDLAEAEHELAANAGRDPRPTELQQVYLHQSRRAAGRRQRALLGGVTAALVVSVALGVVAVLQRNTANDRARVAESKTLSLQSVDALATAPSTALGDAVKAFETSPTPEARLALRRAILANPIELSIPVRRRRGPTVEPALAWSGDGARLLGLTPTGRLRLWNSANGRDVADQTDADVAALGPGGHVLSARGRRIRLAGGTTPTVRYAPAGKRIVGVGFAGEKPLALVAGGGTVALLDVASGTRVRLQAPRVSANEAVFSPDGKRVVTLGSAARVWDTGGGRLLATLPRASNAVFSRDGRLVATYGIDRGTELWSLEPRRRVARLVDDYAKVVFSPTGDRLVTVDLDGETTIRRTSNGRLIGTLPGSGGPDQAGGYMTTFDPDAAFSPDGRLVAVANPDGIVRVWELETRKQVGAVQAGWANVLAFAPRDGRLAAMTWDGDVAVARVPASVPVRTGFQPDAGCPGFAPLASPDGRLIAAPVAGGAGLWRTDGRAVRVLRPPARTRFAITAGALAFSGDSATAAVSAARVQCNFLLGSERFGTAVWRLDRGSPLSRIWTKDGGFALDTRGALLAAGERTWRTATGKPVRALDGTVALTPDGHRALVFRGRTTRVVDVPSGRTIAVLDDAGRLAAGGSELVAAALSPAGDRVLTDNAGVLRLWDAGTGEAVARLDSRNAYVFDHAFVDAGRHIRVRFENRVATFDAGDGRQLSSHAGTFEAVSDDGTIGVVLPEAGGLDVVEMKTGLTVSLPTDTTRRLTSVTFGPTPGLLVAGDARGDVHIIRCAICAPDDELLRRARATLERVAKQPRQPPISGVVA